MSQRSGSERGHPQPCGATASRPSQHEDAGARSNAFDLLRLVAACCVLVEHSWLLSGNGFPAVPPASSGTTFGQIGLGVFFFTSGYLVLGSWLADPSVRRFAVRRALRIYPLWAIVIVGTALVIGPLLTSLPVGSYFLDDQTRSYLFNGLLLFPVEFELPGVFSDNPETTGVNGSLWTIPLEVLCYIGIVMLGSIGVLRYRWLVTALVLLPVTVYVSVDVSGYTGTVVPYLMDYRGAEMVAFFSLGMLLRVVRPDWQPPWPLAPVTIAVWLICWGTPFAGVSAFIAIAATTCVLAFRSPSMLHHPTGRYDLSYGIYIFSYPAQQAITSFGVRSALINLLLTVVIVLPVAALSWKTVERPSLRLKPRRSRGQQITRSPAETVRRPLARVSIGRLQRGLGRRCRRFQPSTRADKSKR